VAVDAGGNIIVAGDLIDSVDFGGGALVGSGDSFDIDIFSVRLSPSGAHLGSKKFSGAGADDRPLGLAVSGAGPVLAGVYGGAGVDFGMSCGVVSSSDGVGDIFVAGLDDSFNCRWLKNPGSAAFTDQASDVAVGSDGSTLVVGVFDGTIDLDGELLVSAGGGDVFIAKLGVDGQRIWMNHYGDSDYQQAAHVALGPQDRVLIGGTFNSLIDFSEGGGQALQSVSSDDPFVASLNSNGSYAWSLQFLQQGNASLYALAVEPGGDALIAGSYAGAIDLDGVKTSMVDELFVARLDADVDGAVVWAVTFPHTGILGVKEVVVDPDGNVILATHLSGTVNFGGGPITSVGTCGVPADCNDIVLVKLEGESGAHIESRQYGGQGNEVPHDIALAPGGALVVTGSSDVVLDFGGGVSADGGLFVAKFDPWAPP
jgi:hypothetical protein